LVIARSDYVTMSIQSNFSCGMLYRFMFHGWMNLFLSVGAFSSFWGQENQIVLFYNPPNASI